MKVNVNINLNIEAPDSTGFVGDARILLENIIYALQPFEEQIANHYSKWKTTEPIMGTVTITPTNESIGAFLIVPTKEPVTFLAVKAPAFKIGDKLLLTIEGFGKTIKEKVVVTRIRGNTSLVDKGKGLHSSEQTHYNYTVENGAGEIWPASEWELSLYLEA